MAGFVEWFTIEISDIGSKFAVDEDSGGAIVETDVARDERTVPLGCDESAFHYK